MKFFKNKLLILFVISTLFSCSKDDDNAVSGENNTSLQEIHKFMWNGMNQVYLYKDEVADLANNRFSNIAEQNLFFSKYKIPETLYEALKSPQDRFSFLTANYVELEQLFSGVSKSNGMDFSLTLVTENSNDVIGFVRYVLPNTDAAAKGILRGDLFNTIDGERLTPSNYRELLSRDAYTVGFITENNGAFTPSKEVILTSAEYTENPVLISKTINYGGQTIGYLMYTGFTADFDVQLNDAFAKFKTDGITDLVLDLRYNGGGSVRTAIDLSAMITGQFKDQVFSKEIWNKELTAYFQSEAPERLINKFQDTIRTGAAINSLGLTKLHVLATGRTASASELVMNGLEPYIDVVHIGKNTTGKYQASITLYDSKNFGRTNPNPNHTYAIQPLVLKSANKNGVTDFVDGLTPDIIFSEDIYDLGVLGASDEPFLKAALDYIVSGTIPVKTKRAGFEFESIGERKMLDPTYQRMYKDDLDLSIFKN